MKILRGFVNVILGIVIFALIFAFTFFLATKKFVENDLIHDVVKNAIEEATYEDLNLKESQIKAIDEIFNDGEASKIINLALDYYKEYKDTGNINIAKDDVKELYDTVIKYKNQIKEISGTDVTKMSEKEFEEFFNQDEVNKIAKDAFVEFDDKLDDGASEIFIKVYTTLSSNTAKVIIIFAIVALLVIISIINWSIIKWMLISGVCLVTSGGLLGIIYIVFNIFKDAILHDLLKTGIELDLGTYLIASIIEVFIGIVLIVGYVALNKTVFRKNKKKVIVKYVNTVPENKETKPLNNVSNIKKNFEVSPKEEKVVNNNEETSEENVENTEENAIENTDSSNE